MVKETNTELRIFNKQYSVAIDTVPLPEKPGERVRVVIGQIMPIIIEIVIDAMNVAIGTWPTPEKPTKNQ